MRRCSPRCWRGWASDRDPAGAGGAAAIAAIYAPHVVAGLASFETEAPDADAMAARIAAGGDRYPWLVADDGADGAIAGYAYAGAFAMRAGYRWSVETTVYVADHAQRRGVARALYARLIETLVAQFYVRAVAQVALPNPASLALHRAMGFTHGGRYEAIGWKHGRWLDVDLWQRALAAPAEPPAKPLPLSAVGWPT